MAINPSEADVTAMRNPGSGAITDPNQAVNPPANAPTPQTDAEANPDKTGFDAASRLKSNDRMPVDFDFEVTNDPDPRGDAEVGSDREVEAKETMELLAANLTVQEIQEYLGVDSLAYLTLDNLLEATGANNAGFCSACLTGSYPVDIPVNLSKKILEEPAQQPQENIVQQSFSEIHE